MGRASTLPFGPVGGELKQGDLARGLLERNRKYRYGTYHADEAEHKYGRHAATPVGSKANQEAPCEEYRADYRRDTAKVAGYGLLWNFDDPAGV